MNMPLVLLNRRRRGGPAAFSPSALFALAEPGVWYDPSDLTTLFTDTAGTQPVTTPGQTVALALDKSKGLVLGSELVTNGDFSNGTTGWTGVNSTLAEVSGAGEITVTSTSAAPRGSQTITTVSGTWYEARARLWQGTGSVSMTLLIAGIASSASVSSTTPTEVVVRFQATGTTATLRPGATTTGVLGTTYYIDNISVRELPGFHATQATAASRPTYGIVPATGRRNLLTRTEEFNDAVWVKSNGGVGIVPTVTANAGASPDGTTTADRVQYSLNGGTASADISRIYQANTATGAVTFSFWARATDGASSYAMYVVTAAGSNALTVTGSWQRFEFTATSSGSVFYSIGLRGGLSPTNANTADILIWGAQLETGSTATAYQRVGSAFDVTEAGVTSLSYLSFDGVDDFLLTPTITPGTDKAQVFAGVRKLSDANIGVVAEFSTNSSSTTAGVFGLIAPRTVGATYGTHLRGTARMEYITASSFAAPISNVLSALYDIAETTAELENRLRVNGATQTLSVVDAQAGPAGTGNFSAQPLYIGRRGGTTLPFNGNLFSLIVRFGTNIDAGTITSTETWVNGKTGAY